MPNFDDMDDVTTMEDDAYEQMDEDESDPLMGWITLRDLSGDDFSDDEELDDEREDMDEWDDWGDE